MALAEGSVETVSQFNSLSAQSTSQTSIVPIKTLTNLLYTNLYLRVDSLEPDLPGPKPREEKPH